MITTISPPIPYQWRGLFQVLDCDKTLESAETWICDHVTHCKENSLAAQWKMLLQYLSDAVIISKSCLDIRIICVYASLLPWLQTIMLAIIYQHRLDIGKETIQHFVEEVEHETCSELSWNNQLWKLLCVYVGIQDQGRPLEKITIDEERELGVNTADLDSGNVVIPPPPAEQIDLDFSDDMKVESINAGETRNDLDASVVILDGVEETRLSTPVKKLKVEGKEEHGHKADHGLSQDLIVKGSELQEILHSSPDDEELVKQGLEQLLAVSPDQLRAVCRVCGLANLSEPSLSIVCGVLVKMADRVTYSSCVALIAGVLLDRLESLQQTASRTLQGVLTLLATTFPLQLLDAIIQPELVRRLGAPHAEMLSQLCKDCLTKPQHAHLLRKIVAWDIILTESAVSVVHVVLEAQPLLDHQLIDDVLDCLSRSAEEFKTNLKFGKVLLSFINKYGNQWTKTQISTMSQITGHHKTFLRSKIDSVLKKL